MAGSLTHMEWLIKHMATPLRMCTLYLIYAVLMYYSYFVIRSNIHIVAYALESSEALLFPSVLFLLAALLVFVICFCKMINLQGFLVNISFCMYLGLFIGYTVQFIGHTKLDRYSKLTQEEAFFYFLYTVGIVLLVLILPYPKKKET